MRGGRVGVVVVVFFFSSRRRHTRCSRDWSSDVCSSDLSQGVPMILGGDEVGRTQHGNNNAYCQDNEISWHLWPLSRTALAQLSFTKRLIKLRLDHPVFHRRLFFQGRRIHGSAVKDLSWFRPDGQEMTEEGWSSSFTRCLGLR